MSFDESYNNLIINIYNGREVWYYYLKGERVVVIRITEVTVIKKPDVADIEDFVVWAIKERLEVLCGLQ